MNSKKTTEVAVIDFEKFSVAQLPELNGKKEEIKALIEANPAIEVVDNPSYELAKKSRTAVKTLRTGLEKEQKEVKKKIKEHVLDVVDKEYDTIILDVKSEEKLRQDPIDIWEAKKEEERLEKVRLEELRVKNIKEAIQTFKDAWIETIGHMIFEGISMAKSHFEKTVSEFDRVKLAEFEVLFDDAVTYLDTLMNAKITTLTEQENIRLEQLRLAEEREKQRIENEKIAEEQRIEREKFEAEQKLALENQRIAQENFLKEKKEFEEKQLEAKFQARCKQLTDLGFDLAIFETEHEGNPRWMNLLNSAKILADLDWVKELAWVKEMIELRNKPSEIEMFKNLGVSQSNNENTSVPVKLVKLPNGDTVWATKEGVESLESANENQEADTHEEATKGLSIRLKANTPAVEKELTWDDIFKKHNIYKEDCNYNQKTWLSLEGWLDENFNCPTRKI